MEEARMEGQTVVSYCGKCKIDRLHTVVAMDGETMVKVKCGTCEKIHKVREAPDPAKGPAKGREARKAALPPTDAAVSQFVWETCLAEAKGAHTPYSKDTRYSVGDVVDHHAFGTGVVLKLHPNNRCDMIFKDGKRRMLSANQ
jgi:uncharacterized C2H2 Zn-finger protein